MKTLYFLLFSLLGTYATSAQEIKKNLYKGTLNNQQITLYLKQQPNPCGGGTLPLYEGIYQYAKGKKWIELEISGNRKQELCLTEFNFTGVFILKKTIDGLEGLWIGPDGKTQYKVLLRKLESSAKEQAALEASLEQTHYENHDC